MKATVLDASALLALLFDQPGAEKVENLFHQAANDDKPLQITAVNWAEVLYKMKLKHGVPGWEGAKHFESTMPLEVVLVDRDLAEVAAAMKVAYHLGLADAVAAALAKQRKAELITGDHEFKAVEKEIKINWLK